MIQHCKEEDIPYVGQTRVPPGQKPLIPVDSPEAQIIADCLENGDSIRDTTFHLNTWRRDQGKDEFGINPVCSCYMRLKPKIQTIKNGKQTK